MNLYIFAPQSCTYCGGLTLIAAPTLQIALNIGNDPANYHQIAERAPFVEHSHQTREGHCWSLLKTLKLDFDSAPEHACIVASNANYA